MKAILQDHNIPTIKRVDEQVDGKILDGAYLLHVERPSKKQSVKTFSAYAEQLFLPRLIKEFQYTAEIHLIFDRRFDDSLKKKCREGRGSGGAASRGIKVRGFGKLPPNWTKALRNYVIQTGFCEFLAEYLNKCQLPKQKVLKITYKDSVPVNPQNYQVIDLAFDYP